MEKRGFVSVIIPSIRKTLLQPCLMSLEKQTYPNGMFEVIVVSPEKYVTEGVSSLVVRNIVDNRANQAEARNIAEKVAKGEILALCDDDCILPPDWIENGVKHFSDGKVATVGGPSVPPLKGVPLRELISGSLMMSFLGTGSHRKAYTPDSETGPRPCKPVEIICANMLVDRTKFHEVGGFDRIVPQEEDRLNTKFVRKGYKLIYDPSCSNIHYQRPYGFRFVRNIFWLMAGQGSLTMDRLAPSSTSYLIPPFFVVGLIVGPFLLSWFLFKLIYIAAISAYAVIVATETARLISRLEVHGRERLTALVMLPFVFFIHHIASGFGFIFGFFRQFLSKIKSKIHQFHGPVAIDSTNRLQKRSCLLGKCVKSDYYKLADEFLRKTKDSRVRGAGNRVMRMIRENRAESIHRVLKPFLKCDKLKFLDVGCGIGDVSLGLANFGYEVVGIDADMDAIRIANVGRICHGGNVSFSVLNAEDIDQVFSANSFDVVILSEVIEHSQNPDVVLQKIYYALRPGGYLYLTTPNRLFPIDPHSGHFLTSWIDNRLYTWKNLKKKLEKNKFMVHNLTPLVVIRFSEIFEEKSYHSPLRYALYKRIGKLMRSEFLTNIVTPRFTLVCSPLK